ncbi:hypothetical protein ABZT06_38870 [Streptomyces sp. NPDC005483]|uniref:hypothetical protein n=1 Tax=Streptomyces sp. NPDC005483 TaxID=3154882 RepID=UPI0033A76ACA
MTSSDGPGDLQVWVREDSDGAGLCFGPPGGSLAALTDMERGELSAWKNTNLQRTSGPRISFHSDDDEPPISPELLARMGALDDSFRERPDYLSSRLQREGFLIEPDEDLPTPPAAQSYPSPMSAFLINDDDDPPSGASTPPNVAAEDLPTPPAAQSYPSPMSAFLIDDDDDPPSGASTPPNVAAFAHLSGGERRQMAETTAAAINQTLAMLFLRLGPPPEDIAREFGPITSGGGGAQQ